MDNFITKSYQFFKDLFAKKNLLIFILTVVVVLLILLNFKSCNDLKGQKQLTTQNEEAMKKELTVEKNKSGFYQTSVVAFEGKVSDIQKYSDSLAKEIKDLKNRKPEVIIKTQLVYMGDTSHTNNELFVDGNGSYDLDWDFTNSDSTRILKGKTFFNAKIGLFDNTSKNYPIIITPGDTKLLEDEFKLDLTVGVVKNTKTGLDEIFVTPKNSNVKVRTLEGAVINKQKQHYFTIGAQIGYGIMYNKGSLALGPYVGVGLSYNFFNKLFKK